MTAEALAIWGLFFGLWSHELLHRYDEKGGRSRLFMASVVGAMGLGSLVIAAVKAVFG